MKPIISSRNRSRCGDAPSGKCVPWDGPNIPCLDLCTDDMVTDVVYAIGMKVCNLSDQLDLETLDLGCLIDFCDTCPNEKDLKSILQLMLANDCKLKLLIDQIIDILESSSGGEASVINLNYRCLEKLDDFGNPIPQDLNQTLQSIINRLCEHDLKLIDHENRLTIIETTYCKPPCGGGESGYVEPVITLCTSDVPKPLSLATIDLGNNYCDYKAIIGSEEDAVGAISKQCNLTTDPYYTEYLAAGLILNPDSVADSMYNQWILMCKLLQRVNTIETTCCAPSCEDIHIGFDATYDETLEEFTLEFSYAAGTEIPVGVEDCGSVMILTDTEGKTKTIPIAIENGLIFSIPNVSPLSTKDPISVTIKTCFTFPNGLNCKDCVGGVLPAVQPCGFCKMCVVGGTSSDTLFVTYTKNGEMTSQSLRTGDCIYFENADAIEILSVTSSTAGMNLVPDPNNPCDAIVVPEITESICWFFKLPMSDAIYTRHDRTVIAAVRDFDYDLGVDPSKIISYSKLFTFNTPAGIPISGNTITTPEGNADSKGFTAQVPVVNSNEVISNNICPIIYSVIWYYSGIGGPSNAPAIDGTRTTALGDNNTDSELVTFHQVIGDQTQFGVMLKILGQPENIAPFIEVYDPIAQTYMRLQGKAISDCDCASI